jgi:hypothetical protein
MVHFCLVSPDLLVATSESVLESNCLLDSLCIISALLVGFDDAILMGVRLVCQLFGCLHNVNRCVEVESR